MDAEYKDMNESAPIPSLTLEPELENTPKLVVAEGNEAAADQVASAVLSPQEQQMVNDFAQKIDVENTAQILQYGAGTQKKMADFSDAALANVRTQDLGEVGDLIVNVVGELEGLRRRGGKRLLRLLPQAGEQAGGHEEPLRQGRGQCGEDWRRAPAASGTAAEGLRDAG